MQVRGSCRWNPIVADSDFRSSPTWGDSQSALWNSSPPSDTKIITYKKLLWNNYWWKFANFTHTFSKKVFLLRKCLDGANSLTNYDRTSQGIIFITILWSEPKVLNSRASGSTFKRRSWNRAHSVRDKASTGQETKQIPKCEHGAEEQIKGADINS